MTLKSNVLTVTTLALGLCIQAWGADQRVIVTETPDDTAAQSTTNPDVVSKTKIERTRIDDRAPAAADQAGISHEKSVITQEVVERGGLRDEVAAITLHGGVLNMNDASNTGNARAVGGLSAEGNFLAGLPARPGKPFFGPFAGVLYSHLGAPGSNFFGTNSPTGNDDGTHLLLIPLNLKAGYTFNNAFRMSAHGGVTLSYMNVGNQVTTTTATPTTTTTTTGTFRNESWSTDPNVGLDLEFGLGRNVLLLLRPDWTLRSTGNFFTGTLGLGFPLS